MGIGNKLSRLFDTHNKTMPLSLLEKLTFLHKPFIQLLKETAERLISKSF